MQLLPQLHQQESQCGGDSSNGSLGRGKQLLQCLGCRTVLIRRWEIGGDQLFRGCSRELNLITTNSSIASLSWHVLIHHAELRLMIFLHWKMQKFLESSFFPPLFLSCFAQVLPLGFFKQGNKMLFYISFLHSKIKKYSSSNNNLANVLLKLNDQICRPGRQLQSGTSL